MMAHCMRWTGGVLVLRERAFGLKEKIWELEISIDILASDRLVT